MSENKNQQLLDSLDNSIESKNKIKSVLETHRRTEMEGKTFNDYGDILENIFSDGVYKIDLMKSITIDIVYFVPGKGLQHIKQSVEQMYGDDGVALNKIDLNQPIIKNNIKDVEETKIDDTTNINNYNPHLIFDGFISPYFIDENNILDFSTRILDDKTGESYYNDYTIPITYYDDEICIGALYKNFHEDRFYFTTSTNISAIFIPPGTVTTRVLYYKITDIIKESNIKLYWCNKSTNFEFKLLLENNNLKITEDELGRECELIFDFTYNTNTNDSIFYVECTDNISLGKEEKFDEEFSNYVNKTIFDKLLLSNLFFGNQQITENTKIGNNFGSYSMSFKIYNQFLIPKTNKKQNLSFYNTKPISWNDIVTKCYCFPDNVDFKHYENTELIYAVLPYNLKTMQIKEFALFVKSSIKSIVLPKHPDYIFIKQNYDLRNVEFLNIPNFYSRPYPITKTDFFEYSKVKCIIIKKLINPALEYAEFKNFSLLSKLIFPIDYDAMEGYYTDIQYAVDSIGDRCFENCYSLKLNFWNYNLVTSFGNYCFKNCGFSQVVWTLDRGRTNYNLKTIGVEAFADNDDLVKVYFGWCPNLESIGNSCFENCINLNEISFSRSSENKLLPLNIGDSCFKNCEKLKFVSTGEQQIISSFGDSCFENCRLLDINNIFRRQELYDGNIYKGTTSGFNVDKIGNYCFQNNEKTINLEIKNLSLLTSFGEGCFQSSVISSIVLDNLPLLTSIDFTKLLMNTFIPKSITINNCPELSSAIDLSLYPYLEEIIITNCPKITDITIISPKLRKVDFQGSGIILKPSQFSGCTELTDVKVDYTSTTIIPDYCFKGCTKLAIYNLDGLCNLTIIGIEAFSGCVSMKNFMFSYPNLETIGDRAFLSSGLLFPYINQFDNLTTIGDNVFGGSIQSLTINNCQKLTTIGKINYFPLNYFQFSDCPLLSVIKFENAGPGKLESFVLENVGISGLPNNCFQGCTNLYKTLIYNCPNFESFGNNCFEGCTSLCTFDEIGNFIFNDLSSLKYIGYNCFENTKLSTLPNIYVSNLLKLEIIGNNCFTINQINVIELINLPELLSVNNFLGTTTIIKGIYFDNCTKLNLDVIGFTFPMLKTLVIIGCPMLTTLPSLQNNTIETCIINTSGITILPSNCFKECSNLKTLEIENSLIKTIGEFCFNGCINLETIKFPITLNEIGKNCFLVCSKLTYVSFKSYCLINIRAFSGCNILKNFDFKNKTFNSNCFAYCGFEKLDLSTVEVPLSNGIFYSNSKLKEVILPKNLLILTSNSFFNCCLLENITIPASVTNINEDVFNSCKSLRYYIFESKTPPILSSTESLHLSSIFDTKIFVPDASLELYKTATNWVNFKHVIFPISQFDAAEFDDNEKILRFTYYKSGVGYIQRDYICDDMDIAIGQVSVSKIPFFDEMKVNVPSINLANKFNGNWNPELRHIGWVGYDIGFGVFPITRNKVTPVSEEYGVVDESPTTGWSSTYIEIDTKFNKQQTNGMIDFCFKFRAKGANAVEPLLMEIWYSGDTSNVFNQYGSTLRYTDDNIVNLVISDLFDGTANGGGIKIIKIKINKPIVLGHNGNDDAIDYDFTKFSNYTKMFIGDNVLIEKRAFLNHINLNTLVIGNYNTKTTFPAYNHIPNYCFYNCKSLKYLIIPNHLNTKFGSSAFNNCNFKALVYKPNNNLILANLALNGLNTNDFILSNNVTLEPAYNFIDSNIEKFNSILATPQSIPVCCFMRSKIKYFKTGSIYSVDESAFDSCTNIDNLSLNFDGTKNNFVDINAFQNSTIKNIVLTDIKTINNYAFKNCKKLEKINFGTKLTTIGNNVLNNNNLTILDFPASLTSLGVEAIYQNIYIRTIIFRSVVPPVLADSNTFPIISPIRSYRIYVPDVNMDAYKTATNWVKYASFIYPLSSLPISELE